MLANPPANSFFATDQVTPLTASNLTDDAEQFRHKRPKFNGGICTLYFRNHEDLTAWNKLIQLNPATRPALGFRLTILPTNIMRLATVCSIPIQERISLTIVRPDSNFVIADECSHRMCKKLNPIIEL
jgi:hypothetical protein